MTEEEKHEEEQRQRYEEDQYHDDSFDDSVAHIILNGPRGLSYDAIKDVIETELKRPDSDIRKLILSIVKENNDNETETDDFFGD